MARRSQRGFSLLELLIVVFIIMVIAAMSMPSLLGTVRRYQLETSARNVSSVLMRARYEAIRLNQRVNTIYVAPAGSNPAVYGVDEGGPGPPPTNVPDGILQATEPQMSISSAVQMGGVGQPAYTSMGANYATLTPPAAFKITFGSVGTVVYQPPGGPGSPWIESSTIYVILLQHTVTQQWAAVTVTPAGRVRVWIWNGTAWAS